MNRDNDPNGPNGLYHGDFLVVTNDADGRTTSYFCEDVPAVYETLELDVRSFVDFNANNMTVMECVDSLRDVETSVVIYRVTHRGDEFGGISMEVVPPEVVQAELALVDRRG